MSAPSNSGRTRLPGWAIALIVVLSLLLVVPAVWPAIMNAVRPPVAEVEQVDLNTQVIHAVRTTEEISLVSLGIQGIAEQTQQRTIFGMRVPGADRALFLQYDFTAKLGLDGRQVRVTQTGEKAFTISVPEFIFIGHDDVRFKLAAEKNGVLSWVTPEIDTVEMTNSILNDEAQQKYLADNDELLREQTRAFYEGIVAAVDPEIQLGFDYTSGR
ncbi:MAG: hypothetical protein Q4G35_06255 [Propionibacteriaceae bacterium]|nr:hypothetical protein [Propionibacteriaceae bacterium]